MQVSVVVPTYRRPDHLARCLHALARQHFPTGSYEVIVADDAADEATSRLLESLATDTFRSHYVPVIGNHGPAAARNAGWQVARGEIIAFTDDDCIPDSGWLAAGVTAFSNSEIIAVTGQTIVPLPAIPTDHERNTAGLEDAEFITANCFVRRAALERLGGFDEQFTIAWREDSDLHFRLLNTGAHIARANDAVVIHPVRPAAWGVSLREQRKAMFDALLFRQHPRHFCERIKPRWPADYYLAGLAAPVSLTSIAFGSFTLSLVSAAIWLCLTVRFCLRRLKNTARTPAHIFEMLLTSTLIPFLSIYWRLYGAVRFRAFFW